MLKIVNKEECSGCFACVNKCPRQCIKMIEDDEGFLYPKINEDNCVDCGLCEKVCPNINDIEIKEKNIIAYACKNKDENVRLKSSSGGVFYLICQEVIKRNGIVFGAAFDKNFNVRHMYSDTIEGCSKFRGSKYVQSLIGDTYKQAKKFLDNGRLVLFSGTQCQIKGLNLYLGKKYSNLIAIDIICHGVPSWKIFNIYIDELRKKYNSKILNIDFRDKQYGWKNFSYVVNFDNNSVYRENFINNIYMKGFLRDLYLRPSCYQCKSKDNKSNSDISLADYWGVEKIHPEFDDDKGTSLVLVNSEKGLNIIGKIKENLDIINTDIEYAIKNNPCIIKSVKYNERRKKFFKEIKSNNLELAINKSYKVTLGNKIKNKLSYELIRIKEKFRRGI